MIYIIKFRGPDENAYIAVEADSVEDIVAMADDGDQYSSAMLSGLDVFKMPEVMSLAKWGAMADDIKEHLEKDFPNPDDLVSHA
jgi:hypothetical protein